jgi:hypothetical protein
MKPRYWSYALYLTALFWIVIILMVIVEVIIGP